MAATGQSMTGRRWTLRCLTCRVLVVVALLCLSVGAGSVSANAQEVPAGTTTVRIPLVLPASAAIAGGEIGFTQTAGLEYVGFIPAPGVQNPVKTTVGQTTYVGFFSADNRYQPVADGLVMGDLEFTYDGDAAEEVVLREIRLHTKVDAGVDTQTFVPGTVYPVTRASGGGSDSGGANSGDGGSDHAGTDGGSGSGTGAGSGTSGGSRDGWGTVADNDGGSVADEDGTAVVELSPGASVTPGASSGSSSETDGTGSTAIEGATTPLTAGLVNSDTGITVWWPLAVLAVLVLAALFVVLLRRRRQKEAKDQHLH